MSYQVLARKWRPRQFVDVVGQEPVVAALRNALTTGRLHHAYLLTGTRGVGKTTLARILAKSLNCETGVTAEPCGVCKACTEIDQGRFIDLLEVDAASNTGVNDMRELLETAQYVPTAGRYKVYIVDEVHMLSKSAFNAMLKTLEEPPEHVKFILATTDPQKLPITVLSRCLQFNLRNLPPALIAKHLANVLTAETIPFDEPALLQIGHAAAGSVRDSLSILDQSIAYGSGQVRTSQVQEMLGSATGDVVQPLLQHLANGDATALIAELERLAQVAISFDGLLQDIASTLHRIALLQAIPGAQRTSTEDDTRIVALASQLSVENIQVFYQVAVLARRDLAHAPDEATGFSMAMLRMLSFVGSGASGSAKAAGGQGRASTPSPSASAVSAAPVRTTSISVAVQSGTSQSVSFDGDWQALVARASFGGMAQMVARHARFERYEQRQFYLSVDQAQAQFAQAAYADALAKDLQKLFGATTKVAIDVRGGVAAIETVRGQDDQARADRLAEAKAMLLSSPFGQSLVSEFGARIDESTLRVGDITH
jgi:DNA polymerase III subunit gamma/tau